MLIEDHVPYHVQIELVLEALPLDFDPIIVALNTRSEFAYLNELESLLITQETRVDKFKKQVPHFLYVDLTKSSSQSIDPQISEYSEPASINYQFFGCGSQFQGRGFHGGRNGKDMSNVKFTKNLDIMQAIITIVIPQMPMVVLALLIPMCGHNLVTEH